MSLISLSSNSGQALDIGIARAVSATYHNTSNCKLRIGHTVGIARAVSATYHNTSNCKLRIGHTVGIARTVSATYHNTSNSKLLGAGRAAQSVACLTGEPVAAGSIPPGSWILPGQDLAVGFV